MFFLNKNMIFILFIWTLFGYHFTLLAQDQTSYDTNPPKSIKELLNSYDLICRAGAEARSEYLFEWSEFYNEPRVSVQFLKSIEVRTEESCHWWGCPTETLLYMDDIVQSIPFTILSSNKIEFNLSRKIIADLKKYFIDVDFGFLKRSINLNFNLDQWKTPRSIKKPKNYASIKDCVLDSNSFEVCYFKEQPKLYFVHQTYGRLYFVWDTLEENINRIEGLIYGISSYTNREMPCYILNR